MDPIYVTGHRNPDTDSIVGAMAYAALRNALGDREYVAARLGGVSDETQLVLDRFGQKPPVRIHSMYTQVRDLEFDEPPVLSAGVTVGRAWQALQCDNVNSDLPVTNDDGSLYGMLSAEDVAAYDMSTVSNAFLRDIPLFNILSVLEGRLINDAGYDTDMISGEVVVGLPSSRENMMFNNTSKVLICGHQPDLIRRALELNITCLILCQAELDEELRHLATKTCIISTPYDAYKTLRLVFHSVPLGRVCRRDELVSFHLDDLVDDVREVVLKHRFRSYPILDEDEKVVGGLSRYHLLRPRRKRVVLVDHNEAAQSVPGLEEAEILEIIDHHRLADIQTTNPIYFRNEPVGSTNTIIAGMFQEHGLMPSQTMAGLMAAAIVSDTVMFKSPTCTDRDRRMAERMARIANVSLDELGKLLFSSSSGGNRSVHDLLFTDFKEFHIAGHSFGVSQITCVDSASMLDRKQEFLDAMGETMRQRDYSMMLLMLTDVLLEGTQLLYIGDDDTITQAFAQEAKDNTVFLPRVMSRKKQVIPMLTALWG